MSHHVIPTNIKIQLNKSVSIVIVNVILALEGQLINVVVVLLKVEFLII